jgi:hypothetical protein
MRLMTLVAPIVAVALVGCGSNVRLLPGPVAVSGKVTFADGRPVKNLMFALQPTETGHPTAFKLAADGSFRGDIVPGKYAFSLQPQDGPERSKSLAALKEVPEKYRSAHLDHQVDFKASTDAQIKLN